MAKIAKKMPITITLLIFSYLIAACGVGGGGLLVVFKFGDKSSFIYGFLIIAGSLLLAALIRMFTNMGQIIFDIRVDMQKLNQDLINQLQLQTDTLNKSLEAGIQMNCDSKDMNQNIHQIRDFFEKIERHLDLKK